MPDRFLEKPGRGAQYNRGSSEVQYGLQMKLPRIDRPSLALIMTPTGKTDVRRCDNGLKIGDDVYKVDAAAMFVTKVHINLSCKNLDAAARSHAIVVTHSRNQSKHI